MYWKKIAVVGKKKDGVQLNFFQSYIPVYFKEQFLFLINNRSPMNNIVRYVYGAGIHLDGPKTGTRHSGVGYLIRGTRFISEKTSFSFARPKTRVGQCRRFWLIVLQDFHWAQNKGFHFQQENLVFFPLTWILSLLWLLPSNFFSLSNPLVTLPNFRGYQCFKCLHSCGIHMTFMIIM